MVQVIGTWKNENCYINYSKSQLYLVYTTHSAILKNMNVIQVTWVSQISKNFSLNYCFLCNSSGKIEQ